MKLFMERASMRVHEALRRNSLNEALGIANDIVRYAPSSRLGWLLMSQVFAQAKRWTDAVVAIRNALELSPGDKALLLQHALILVRMGQTDKAIAAAEVIGEQGGLGAEMFDALGSIFAYAEQPTRALRFFEQAVGAEPHNAGYLYNLATAKRMAGDLSSAEEILNTVSLLNPDDAAAYHLRADLRVQTVADNHVVAIRSALERSSNVEDRIRLSFALAKELEDLGDFDASFDALTSGCSAHRRRMTYAVRDDVKAIDRIIDRYDISAIKGRAGCDMDNVIFVLGLPRSGTTLVERILASHSAVHGAGELSAFPAESIKAVQRRVRRPVNKLEFADLTLEVEPFELGESYRTATAVHAARATYFIDKQPTNYLYAGLITRCLPKARIVALARDPLDSCYAMYKTLFADMYPFSYDLKELAQYYVAWHRLMTHWRNVLGDQLLIVNYEDLVFRQEETSRRLLDHCGLEWEAECLEFYRTAEGITTASASQVRRPIYASSVGKWRNYARQLGDLADALAPHEPARGWRFD